MKQWDAHLLTKQHRMSVAREKASQAKVAATRPAEDGLQGGAKRSRRGENHGKEDDEDADEDEGPRGLPAGFFSAGTGPTAGGEDDDEDLSGPSTSAPAPVAHEEKTGDVELDDFLASLAHDGPAGGVSEAIPAVPTRRAVASRRADDALGVASYEAAPVRNVVEPQKEQGQGDGDPEPEPEPEETERERRERLAREEREEIMGRLEEEERAQWVASKGKWVCELTLVGKTRIRACCC